jgi:hypothetical protein
VSPRNAVVWHEVVDRLANALQVAIGLAAEVRRSAQTAADETVALERAIQQATAVLSRLQPRTTQKRRGKR